VREAGRLTWAWQGILAEVVEEGEGCAALEFVSRLEELRPESGSGRRGHVNVCQGKKHLAAPTANPTAIPT